jgi:hypothetical protein
MQRKMSSNAWRKRLMRDFFAVKHFGPQKAGKALLLGIGEERGEVGCGFKSGIFLS